MTAERRRDIGLLLAILVLAAFLRILFKSGVEGSDDVVYLNEAYKIYSGQHTLPTYIAQLRLGNILPIALMFKIFGPSEFTLFLWSLIASIANIFVIYLISKELFGKQPAILASFSAVFFPLDIHMSGRAMAETSLTLMLTTSVFFYFLGYKRQGQRKAILFYMLSGVFVGLAALNKHVAIFVLFFFVIHCVINKTSVFNLLYLILGGFLVFIIENVYLYMVSGDSLFLYHMFSNVLAVNRQHFLTHENAPLTYYLYYMLISIQHVGLYFYLALFGLAYAFLKKKNVPVNDTAGVKFLLLWGLSLVGVMTFLPFSIRPLLFLPKQATYMMMFSVPFVIIGGYSLSLIPKKGIQYALILILCSTSLFCAYFQRNTIKSHAHNTEAAFQYIAKYPGALLVTGEYNTHYCMVYNMLHKQKIAYRFFDEIINGGLNINKSAYRYQKRPGDDQRFIDTIKTYEKVIVLYDLRMAERQKGRYYYPDPAILTEPESNLKLVATIKKDRNQLERIVEATLSRFITVVEQHGFTTYARKMDNLMWDVFHPDPAYLFVMQ